MHILYLDWPCFCGTHILNLFEKREYTVTKFSHPEYFERFSDSFLSAADTLFSENEFDFCFSYNFFPLMARACNAHNCPYISFVYDNPQVKLYSYTAAYPTNYIFVFDSEMVQKFRNGGLETFYYMPLPVDGTIIDQMLTETHNITRYSSEISFVGALYNEDHNLFDRLTDMNPYAKGYLDAIMQAQSKVYGYSLIEECLTEPIIEEMQRLANYPANEDGVETLSYIFADYFISRKLTSMERVTFLSAIANRFPLKLFTLDQTAAIPGATNMGTVDYYKEMPYVFYHSKINMNISLRSIHTGIPLRCMDIMGSKGFLLTNYQSDFLLHFTPDEDYVYFENEEDMLHKIDYYLTHEDKRQAIAESGHDKVLRNHNYDVIFDEILEIVFPS